ncbi:Protein of unknown function [Chitinophaga ginsengisegetis]|uniref:DUF3347 domain-containing protein n=1 Tax=Chitinophaga ginsengisegetis TaxID=393003 RepID=A0A1T5P967_9BACT|nr:DUF3347 domain-containing protein [Chitinophaga ginsengisegetis]SKD09305.1 Protein of unknown function [Chitinophaga ginsengisegetis]
MKQFVKFTVAPLAALIFLAACGNNNPVTKEQDSTSQHETIATSPAIVQLKDDKLHAVYQHYVLLSAALVKGDVKAARLAGNAIETGASEITGGEAIGAGAAKITATADIATQRIAFSALSNDFISLAKKSGLSSGQLYVDFCPMAMNDKGAYWLSSDKAIQNPYFGDQMLTCGEVKETIQ